MIPATPADTVGPLSGDGVVPSGQATASDAAEPANGHDVVTSGDANMVWLCELIDETPFPSAEDATEDDAELSVHTEHEPTVSRHKAVHFYYLYVSACWFWFWFEFLGPEHFHENLHVFIFRIFWYFYVLEKIQTNPNKFVTGFLCQSAQNVTKHWKT